MAIPILDIAVDGRFMRKEEYDLRWGLGVIYRFVPLDFMIIASRGGVTIRGTLPGIPAAGADMVAQVLNRAKRQHLHLASFAVGVKQVALTEEQLNIDEMGTPVGSVS